MEQTLSLIKPDGVERGLVGEVIKRFESAGMRIVALKMTRLSREFAQSFYAEHQGKPFYDRLTEFMYSGPIVAMVIEGENVIQRTRVVMGATDYREAAPGTIRHDLARDVTKNIVHGSDCATSAAREIPFFFSSLEIHCREREG
jgi:nucleoside-diphosphate kinase